MNQESKGRYHNDYSPRYHEAYDIYEKARNHMKERKKKEKKQSNAVHSTLFKEKE